MNDESEIFLLTDDSSVANEDSSYDDDDDLELFALGKIRQKNENLLRDIVPGYSGNVFFEHFRVSSKVVLDISSKYGRSNFYNEHCGPHGNISAHNQVLIFLWYMGHEAASYRDVADRFDVSISSLNKVIRRVTYFVSNLSANIIIWPNDVEKSRIEENFRRNGFPNIIGAVDGCHIAIDKPEEDPDSYLNLNHYYSIQMQVTCDHKMKITDVFIGYPGSFSDSRVFSNSTLGKNLQVKCGRYFVLGDSGYPLKPHLLTPYKNLGTLTRRQINFNQIHAKNYYVIKHCFVILKQKFRQLYKVKLRNVNLVVNFIRAACVLHNIALNDEFHLDEGNIQVRGNEQIEIPTDEGDNEEDEVDIDARRIRDIIANGL